MWHSHLNDMDISERERFIPRGFELSTTELVDLVYFVEEKDMYCLLRRDVTFQ